MTGTRVPQDVLADGSTTMRLPQTVPQALKTQKQNGKTKQKTLHNLDMENITETRCPRTEIRKRENRKWNKYFAYIDMLI